MQAARPVRLLVVVVLGALAFNMQDVLLEPYGGEILGLSVSATTLLTASSAMGALVGFGLAARWLARRAWTRSAWRRAGSWSGIAALVGGDLCRPRWARRSCSTWAPSASGWAAGCSRSPR